MMRFWCWFVKGSDGSTYEDSLKEIDPNEAQENTVDETVSSSSTASLYEFGTRRQKESTIQKILSVEETKSALAFLRRGMGLVAADLCSTLRGDDN